MTTDTQSIAVLASMFFSAKLKGAIELAGFKYLGAISETGLLKHVQEHSPICIVIDLAKEDVDCVSLIAAIRGDQSCASLPIIAFCGHMETGKLNAARKLGCDVVTSNGTIVSNFDFVLEEAMSKRCGKQCTNTSTDA